MFELVRTMKDNKNELTSGNGSTNIQGRDHLTVSQTNHYGISAGEARSLALDVFKANFFDLSKEAKVVAEERAEELTDKLIGKLKEEHQNFLEEFKNPDMQYMLFEAQKTYARKGNKDVAEVLIDLLVERTKNTEENLLQITLNGAITVMHQLTKKHIDLLTLVFTSFYLTPMIFNYKENIEQYFNDHFIKFFHSSFNDWDYQHFNYCGVAIFNSIGERNFGDYMINSYRGLYNRGISNEEYQKLIMEDSNISKYFIPHVHNNGKWMTVFGKEMGIDGLIEKMPEVTSKKLKAIISQNAISSFEIYQFIKQINSKLVPFVEYLEKSGLKNTSLTGVGIAIAITNLKINGIDYPLSNWITG